MFDLTVKYGRKGADGEAELLKKLCRGRDLCTESYTDKDMEAISDDQAVSPSAFPRQPDLQSGPPHPLEDVNL